MHTAGVPSSQRPFILPPQRRPAPAIFRRPFNANFFRGLRHRLVESARHRQPHRGVRIRHGRLQPRGHQIRCGRHPVVPEPRPPIGQPDARDPQRRPLHPIPSGPASRPRRGLDHGALIARKSSLAGRSPIRGNPEPGWEKHLHSIAVPSARFPALAARSRARRVRGPFPLNPGP